MSGNRAAKKKTVKKVAVQRKARDLSVADGIPVHCACDDILDVDKVKPYPWNANMHPEDQVLLLAKLIHGHGWRGPITISNQTGLVVRGHGRLAAARKLGSSEVPVDYQDYASPELERADRVADNRIQELSEWDRSLLRDELNDLDSGVLQNMDLTGWEGPSLADLMTAAPPPGGETGGELNTGPTEGKNNGEEGRKRLLVGDLELSIDNDLYDSLLKYLRQRREDTGNDFQWLIEELLQRAIK